MTATRARALAAATLLLAGGVVTLEVSPARADRLWGASYFPNVALTTQDGVTVRFYDDLLKGKSVAINLIYTSCKDECPLETARLVQVHQLLGDRVGKDIFFYSISIDPVRDTPARLKAYAQKFGAGPGWLFLTGAPADIRLVSRKLGLSRLSDGANRDRHMPILMIGTEPTGRWMRNSAVDNPRFLAATIGNFMGWSRAEPAPSYAAATKLEASDAGAYVFESRCAACHTIGRGDTVGPDLAGVTARRDRGWLVRYLRHPDRMLEERDPVAVALSTKYDGVPMPNLRLSDGEITAVLSFLESQSRGSEGAASTR